LLLDGTMALASVRCFSMINLILVHVCRKF
jgi:hypothetical protein